MKNREFLNLIGSVNEDYVQAADSKVIRPRFRWKIFVASAACAVLMICAYPMYRMFNPPLHDYTVMESSGTMTGEADATDNLPGGAYVGGDSTPSGGDLSDVPMDKVAASQYDQLLQGMGVHGDGEPVYPDWFAGAWFDDGELTVGIVDGFQTPELEMEIKGWVQADMAFQSAKYSYTYLEALMQKTEARIEGTGLSCGIDVDVFANRLGVDLYIEETTPEFKKVLAALAELDPTGDAIQVRVIVGQINTLADEMKDDSTSAPVPGSNTEPTPGAVQEDSVQEEKQLASVEE